VHKLAQEMRIACSVTHPNVLRALGRVVLPGPFPALVLELMAGGSLDCVLHGKDASRPPLASALKLQLSLEVAFGLHYLHSRGITHRDVKTANVLLTDKPRGDDEAADCAHVHAKLSDFGICTRFGMEQTTDVGTTRYMAPEIVFGPYDHRADIYSWGLLAWELMHEAIPFSSVQSVVALLMLTDNARPACDVPRMVSRSMANVIESCWHTSPGQRPSMTWVVERMQRIQARQVSQAWTQEDSGDMALQLLRSHTVCKLDSV